MTRNYLSFQLTLLFSCVAKIFSKSVNLFACRGIGRISISCAYPHQGKSSNFFL